MSLEIIEKIRESDSLELALDNALNKLKRAVKKRNDDLHLLNVVTVVFHFGKCCNCRNTTVVNVVTVVIPL